MHVMIKRFKAPDEVREFPKGKLELVRIGETVLGRASYEPGWRWSEHVGAETGERSCKVDHLGLVLSGRIKVLMDNGREFELGPGDVFAIGPGHDAWVVGDEPYVSLHLEGADEYAAGH